MPFVRLRAILPKGQLQDKVIARFVRNKVVDEGRILERALTATVSTWRDAPTFKAKQRVAPSQGPSVSVTVAAGGSAEAVDHFKFVNAGTAIRWAVMHPDFKPKTSPNSLRAGPGSPPFDPIVRGRRNMFRARPGIVARNFTVKIKQDRQPKFSAAIRAAIRRGLAVRG